MSDFRTIVVTTDFSETSRHVFPAVAALASRFGSRVLALHVVEDRLPPFVDELTALPMDETAGGRVKRATDELDAFVAESLRGLQVERIVLLGVPHLEIVRLAEERGADLIAMATHGGGFISHALFGSTTERVVRRAPCPVLTARGRESGSGP
jgi:nucleotide-binding universal stress UspA family protein